jgi:pimeloyl-ACP methyl ester carboxylesterase
MFGKTNGVDCGYLYVTEDRSQSGSPEIKLAVAIIRSTNPTPAPDPVLLLVSWLGGAGSQFLEFTDGVMVAVKEIRNNRDVILFDQRGAGYSSTFLECDEVASQIIQDAPQNLSTAESERHRFQAYRACYDRLSQTDVNLSAYTNTANAADVNDLRKALGYTEWNIVGDTYGTRLALTVMRDFPEGVRSVVLDSVYPLEANLDAEAAVNAERALNLLFERCAADETCNAAYPDLESVFYDAAVQLDAKPISFDLVSLETRQEVKLLINGDRLINLIVHLLNFTDALPYIPSWIYKFYEGNADSDFMLKNYMQFFIFSHEISSEGKGLLVQCSEKISIGSTQASEITDTETFHRLQDVLSQGQYLSLCPAWNVEPAAESEIQPVVSNIPALLLTGENDPGFPPAWGISTAENLSNSFYFEFPWASQGLMYGASPASNCAKSMISAFIADPTTAPKSACIDSLQVNFIER